MRALLSILLLFNAAKAQTGSVADFILKCRKENGAFGPIDQTYTDAAWNYPAVKTMGILGMELENPEEILRHGLGSPKGHVGYGHWLFFHQHGVRQSLGVVDSPKFPIVQLHFQGEKVNYYGSPFGTDAETFFNAGGPELDPRDMESQSMGYYNLSSLYYLLAGLQSSGRTAANPCELADFITYRQAPCGGFVDIRLKGFPLEDSHAHVAHTLHALASLRLLERPLPNPEKTIQFLQSCQRPTGGFRWNSSDQSPGNYEDIYYTWAAVSALKLLESQPLNPEASIAWTNSLQNSDGGFGDKPGWRSRLYSTYYAIDTLAKLEKEGDPRRQSTPLPVPTNLPQPLPQDLQIYQALMKTPMIEPSDLGGLQKRGFDLIGIKSYDFEKAAELQKFAHSMNPPMEVVLCPEAYPHRAEWIGGPQFHHIANVPLNPSWTSKQIQAWNAADALGKDKLPWKEYQQNVIQPILNLNTLVYPEQDFEMEFAYCAYDDGLYKPYSYNAMLCGFNWSPRDFVRIFPWRERYTQKLIPIADADAHGDLLKWSPQLDHTRMLFLAKSPSWNNFKEAARKDRVVCVIRNKDDTQSPVTFYGSSTAVEHLKTQTDSWKWWQ